MKTMYTLLIAIMLVFLMSCNNSTKVTDEESFIKAVFQEIGVSEFEYINEEENIIKFALPTSTHRHNVVNAALTISLVNPEKIRIPEGTWRLLEMDTEMYQFDVLINNNPVKFVGYPDSKVMLALLGDALY